MSEIGKLTGSHLPFLPQKIIFFVREACMGIKQAFPVKLYLRYIGSIHMKSLSIGVQQMLDILFIDIVLALNRQIILRKRVLCSGENCHCFIAPFTPRPFPLF